MTLPPPNKQKISSLVALIFAGVPLLSYATTYEMTGGNVEFNEWDSNNAASFDELNINITPRIEWDYYTINADGKSFTVNNKTQVISISNDYQVVSEDHEPIAVYTFHAKGSSGVINLRGDIDAIMLENTTVPTEPPNKIPYAGVNLFYAQDGGSINLGSTGSTVRAWALGKKPDLISAKQGGKVKIDSTNNQLVGNIDTLGKDFGSKGSSVTGTFSGADSFWFGDEQTWQDMPLKNIEIVVKNPIIEELILKEVKEYLDSAHNELSLSFADGAQWSYIGSSDAIQTTVKAYGYAVAVSVTPVQKRISNIELLDGGIVNLFDEDLKNKWKEVI